MRATEKTPAIVVRDTTRERDVPAGVDVFCML